MNKPQHNFFSLKTKAIALALASGIIITAVTGYYASRRAGQLMYQSKIERMDALGRIFGANAEHGVLLQDKMIADKLCYGVTQEPDVLFALVFDERGNIFAGNYGGIPSKYFSYIKDLIHTKKDYLTKMPQLVQKDPFAESEMIIQPIYSMKAQPRRGGGALEEQADASRDLIGYSAIVFSLKSINLEVHKVRLMIAFLSGIVLLLIVIFFYAIANFLINNVRRLLEAAGRLEKGDLSARVNIHSHDEIEELGEGFNKMAEEIQEKTREIKEALFQVKQASLETIYRLSLAAEYRDWDTGHHLLRMCHYAEAIARKMGLNKKFVEAIMYAALMHDVGKIGIPDQILRKPGKLTPEEWEIMKKHTTIGGEILKNSEAEFIKLAARIALTHHEKWDGTGYPKGLKGDEIDLAGRIAAVADVFEAITSQRPYKEPFPVDKAFEIIEQGKGHHFDPEVVNAFFAVKDEILTIKNRRYTDDDIKATNNDEWGSDKARS